MSDLNSILLEPAGLCLSFLYHYFDDAVVLERFRRQLGEPNLQSLPAGVERLQESIRYSLLQPEAKRFRPALSMLTARALEFPEESVLPFAAALECIHTYSLIHDDLPAMDNDDQRRGQPTNHIKFDQATAILAGDALLTEAFAMIGDAFQAQPKILAELVLVMARAAGGVGMVGGQVMDMAVQDRFDGIVNPLSQTHDLNQKFELVRRLHRLKTGCLIRAASHGAAIIAQARPAQLRDLVVYADLLGLAFQVADDILDHSEADQEACSIVATIGMDRTRLLLKEITDSCLGALRVWSSSAEPLREIARYNQTRQK